MQQNALANSPVFLSRCNSRQLTMFALWSEGNSSLKEDWLPHLGNPPPQTKPQKKKIRKKEKE